MLKKNRFFFIAPLMVGVGTTLGSVENATSDGFEAEQRETMTGDSWRQMAAGAL